MRYLRRFLWIANNNEPKTSPHKTPTEIEERIIYIRKNYYFGPQRISWYLARYHQYKIAASTVRMVLVRNNLQKLPQNQRKRTITARLKDMKNKSQDTEFKLM